MDQAKKAFLGICIIFLVIISGCHIQPGEMLHSHIPKRITDATISMSFNEVNQILWQCHQYSDQQTITLCLEGFFQEISSVDPKHAIGEFKYNTGSSTPCVPYLSGNNTNICGSYAGLNIKFDFKSAFTICYANEAFTDVCIRRVWREIIAQYITKTRPLEIACSKFAYDRERQSCIADPTYLELQ